MQENEKVLISLKNTKYFHSIFYEYPSFLKTSYFDFKFSEHQQIACLHQQNDSQIFEIKKLRLPDIFTEKDFQIDEDENFDLNVNSQKNIFNLKNKKEKKCKNILSNYISFDLKNLIVEDFLIFKKAVNLICFQSENQLSFVDYTKMSNFQTNFDENNFLEIKSDKKISCFDWENLLVAGCRESFLFYDIYQNKKSEVATTDEIFDVKFLNENEFLFCDSSFSLKLKDLRAKEFTEIKKFKSQINSVEVLSNFDNFFGISKSTECEVFDFRNSKKSIFEIKGKNLNLKFNPHEKYILTFEGQKITIYDFIKKEKKYFNDFQQQIFDVQWNKMNYGEFCVSGEVNSTICVPNFFTL